MYSYDVLTHCDSCSEFKFCRLTQCADDICAFCPDCDKDAGDNAPTAIDAKFENAYPDMGIKQRRTVDLPPGKKEADEQEKGRGAKFRLFPLGRVVATPGALAAMTATAVDPASLLARHTVGDWGDISKTDWKENEDSLNKGFLLISSYRLPGGAKVWILTERDRSATTLLLPSEC
jgi:hypothetical protein